MANQVIIQKIETKSSGDTTILHRSVTAERNSENSEEYGALERRRTSSWHLFGSGSVKGAHKWVRRCSYL